MRSGLHCRRYCSCAAHDEPRMRRTCLSEAITVDENAARGATARRWAVAAPEEARCMVAILLLCCVVLCCVARAIAGAGWGRGALKR